MLNKALRPKFKSQTLTEIILCLRSKRMPKINGQLATGSEIIKLCTKNYEILIESNKLINTNWRLKISKQLVIQNMTVVSCQVSNYQQR